MKRLSFANHLLIPGSALVIFACIAVSCTRKGPEDGTTAPGAFGDPNANNNCEACFADSFQVQYTSRSNGETTLIDEAVAILFFNQARLADKYDNENSYDTLMKIFQMEDAGDRNVIYVLKNQHFYFVKTIEPILTEHSIAIIDSVSTDRLLEFRGPNMSIFVNPEEYKNQDGVLFFLPGKKPLSWTAYREERYCKHGEGIVEQYFLCRTGSE